MSLWNVGHILNFSKCTISNIQNVHMQFVGGLTRQPFKLGVADFLFELIHITKHRFE